jgi:PAS domain S-box-containing protein
MGWREQAALYRADDQKVIESGVAKIAYEEPQTAPDGRKIWLRTSKVPFRDHHGNVIGVLGVYEDFTAYKENAEALQQSEARSRELAAVLRNMCDNVPDMIWMKDLSKRYVFANRAMSSDLLGATDADEPVGKTDLYFALRERAAHPDDPEWHTFGELCQDSDDVTLKNDRPSVFEEFGNVKGRYICLDVHKAPFRNANGEVVGIVGSARDVTERQRISRELEQYRMGLEELVQQRTAELVATEARASHILQSSADGLIGLDRAGLITFINTAACSMFGYTPEQAIGRSAHLLLHGRKPDGSPYPEKECPGNAVLTSGQPQRIDNEIFWHADGHGIPVMYALHPMIKDGEHAGTVISVVDMTAQRAAAQAREEALAAAENLARVRREFLANMSHEIRTPLNGVLGFAQIGMRNASQPEKAHNAFEKIITSGNVLLGVINDILDFSKIDAGKIVIEQTDVDLSMLLEEVIDLVGARARGKQIELRLDKAADFPRTCKGDALRLRHVLLNLLSNSVKFTEAGTVTLSASLRQGQLVFSVTDTGIGMSGEQIGKLFTPFQQGDGSTTRKFGGTGLGLAISKGLVDLMGGEIRVESRLGAGSTFEVLLPFVPVNPVARSPAPAVAGAAAAGQSLAGVSILVAEDDAFNRMLLEETLKADDGAQLRVVENGLEAVAAVEREGAGAFDIVLMDLQMPEMDGYEATRRILAIAPGLPIIGQTAHALADDRKKCLAAGMVDHIAKPINLAQLVALIQRHALRRPRNS